MKNLIKKVREEHNPIYAYGDKWVCGGGCTPPEGYKICITVSGGPIECNSGPYGCQIC